MCQVLLPESAGKRRTQRMNGVSELGGSSCSSRGLNSLRRLLAFAPDQHPILRNFESYKSTSSHGPVRLVFGILCTRTARRVTQARMTMGIFNYRQGGRETGAMAKLGNRDVVIRIAARLNDCATSVRSLTNNNSHRENRSAAWFWVSSPCFVGCDLSLVASRWRRRGGCALNGAQALRRLSLPARPTTSFWAWVEEHDARS